MWSCTPLMMYLWKSNALLARILDKQHDIVALHTLVSPVISDVELHEINDFSMEARFLDKQHCLHARKCVQSDSLMFGSKLMSSSSEDICLAIFSAKSHRESVKVVVLLLWHLDEMMSLQCIRPKKHATTTACVYASWFLHRHIQRYHDLSCLMW